jgi:translocation and assembly module TamB
MAARLKSVPRRLMDLMLAGLALIVAVPFIAIAQDSGEDYQDMSNEEQKDWLTQFVQDRLSTPERQISLSNIDGILGSDVSVREITISDQEGVWLRINNARLNWNQAALFLGRLEVRSLAADSIEYIRNAVPAEDVPTDLPPPEAGALAIPEFPVAIDIQEISVPRVAFGESVFGLGSAISLAGAFTLEGGNLDASLDIVRLDGPGGTLDLDVAYTRETDSVDIGVTLTEPEDGILANLMNIEGRPSVSLTLAGSGPVSDLVTELTFAADGETVLSGGATLEQALQGLVIDAELRGAISPLLYEQYRPFFGEETTLTANALIKSEGGLVVSDLRLIGGQLSLSGQLETTPDNFLRRLDLDAVIADAGGDPVVLPVPGGATRIDRAELDIAFGADDSDNWTGDLTVAGLSTPDFAAETMALDLGGVAANLDDETSRRLTLNGDGVISGITASEEVEAALGDSIGLGIAGLWEAGSPIQVAELRLAGEALTAVLTGTLDDFVFTGDIGLETASIAPFSGLAGRDLSGALDLAASGSISPLIGGFDLTLDGTGTGLSIGDEIADRLLEGTVALSGRVARTEQGLEAENFRLGNEQLLLTANGVYSTGAADFTFDLDLADLALLSQEASGALSVTGTAQGAEGIITLALDASVPSGTLDGRPLRDARFGFEGTLVENSLSGDVSGTAFLDGHSVSLATDVTANAEGTRLEAISFETAGTRITGDLIRRPAGLLSGNLAIDATDISNAAALALLDASGAVDADLALSIVEETQSAEISGAIRDLRVEDIRIGAADITASISDLFGVPAVDGTLTGSEIVAAGTTIETLSATASHSGETTSFEAAASLATGTDIDVAGSLAQQGEGYRLALDRAELVQGRLSASLASPTVLIVDGNTVALDAVRFDVGSGSIIATGTAGETLDIDLTVNALPLSIANAVVPDLGLAGTLNGTARITGSGSAPRATFSVEGSGLNAAAIREFGIAPLSVSANGSFADGTVTLAAIRANGSGGLQVSGSGTIPLEGNGLSLTLTGSAPLSLGNRFVADRGGQLSGVARLDARVTGSLASPRFGGSVSVSGAGYIDPQLNLRLTDITGRASLSGNEARIESLSASLATGGSISASGTVGLTGRFPANINIALNSARYADGHLFVATGSGNLAITGNLLGNPLLSGDIFLEEANITVPETFGGGAALIDVEHINTPPAVDATLDRARIDDGGAPVPASRPAGLLLDVMVNAPNQVFIRGRGLDAEMGGSVRLTGPLGDIQPVGAFDLIRGRLSLLGQRITFETGSVTLVGDLDPFINLVARTEGDGITVFVTVSGRVSQIDVSFTSNPALPQDEVLARLIFNRSVGELTPLQLARLAGAVAELAGGGGGGGLLGSLRSAAGLADLDIVTDDQGNVGVQAGTYIQDNVYLGVQAGAGGDSRVTINLDVTEDLKITGAAGSDGDSSLGVFYEKDY